MLIDCPCGEMYDGSHCPKCGRKANLRDTDEAHDHDHDYYIDDDCDEGDLEDEGEGEDD